MAAADRTVVDLAARRRDRRGPARADAPAPLLRTVYGEILRDERRDQDRTLAEVARAVGMSKQYLSEVERGRKEPSSEMLHSVCGALGLPLEHLLARGVRRLAVTRRAGTGALSGPPQERSPQVELLAA
ncbi:helix-turn-helix domain-containing protein [Rhodococcus tukisamuensis]|uniref:DNA-binding transcriptional regulator, XRE-family HTH domain n=1 Tax=Rhodococcus tukisamuensis TaxID=168276 RepID=A0A1G6R521_9NOCA|nr:helix-turn-helix transcriptional regulator [Rhodococcus tukisamuensis]SDC99719.1 DNA-binding transcriptional regulator, XRE-family HTH domain [Rhodococcus tukisamuensis]